VLPAVELRSIPHLRAYPPRPAPAIGG
jgi:hypothetical protein